MAEIYNLDELASKIFQNNSKATLWDVFVELLSTSANIDPYRIWIMSDYPILELIATGMDIGYIADFLEIPKQEVIATCKIWGLTIPNETLDFNPLLVYNEGMTVDEVYEKIEPVLHTPLDKRTLDGIMVSVDKFREVRKMLDEWEGIENDRD